MNERKRIIHFVPELNEGGAEKLVCDYCKHLKQDRYNVFLLEIFPPYDSITYRKILQLDIPLFYVYPKKNKFWLMVNKFWGKQYIPYRLKRLFKKIKPDVVHLHLSWLRFFQLFTEYLKNKNIKLFYTCHNTPPYYFAGRKEKEFYAAKKLIKENNLQLIALSEQMKNELDIMFGISNTKVIHNAIDVDRYGVNALPKEEIRNKLGIEQNAFVVGHIGRFSEQKNHKLLISLFFELYSRDKSAFLLLVGSGELKEEIEERLCEMNIRDRVLILSARNDIPDILNAMDVFVFPSLFEGLGIALIEAQFAGLKCVTADCVPLDAYVSDNVTTLSITESIDMWVDAILNQEPTGKKHVNEDAYIMAKEIKKLENLYNI